MPSFILSLLNIDDVAVAASNPRSAEKERDSERQRASENCREKRIVSYKLMCLCFVFSQLLKLLTYFK